MNDIMSDDKKRPPPPAMPPSFQVKKDFCKLHKGIVMGEVYECTKCGEKYCKDCAVKAKAEREACVKCKAPIFV